MASEVSVPGKTNEANAAAAKANVSKAETAPSGAARPAASTPASSSMVVASTPNAATAKADTAGVKAQPQKAAITKQAVAKSSATKAATSKPVDDEMDAKAPNAPTLAHSEDVQPATSTVSLVGVKPAEALRSLAEQSLAQARAAFAKSQETTENFAKGFESSSEVVQSGLKEIQVRMTEAIEAQTQATFGYFRSMYQVHSLSEAIDVQSSEIRRGFERTMDEAKELSSLAQTIASKATEPVRKAFDTALSSVRSGH